MLLLGEEYAYMTEQNVLQICMDGFEITQHTLYMNTV